ncbi:MAG: hypothetical protein H6755_06225 [Candidatus Omnitrophica bacterium]|nr:hypothetical protein [Candidatus Omnitrophota bacterium]MCB9747987.1 hypothetical protein [Candidatus Omnitrophota bacterium]
MSFKTIKQLVIVSAIAGLFMTVSAEATLNLSVNPIAGGNNLRFGRVDRQSSVNKEVRIRISSNEGTQYQVFQRLVEPFQNDKGQTLGMDAINAYTLLGSNSSGTLYLQNLERLGYSEQLVYSSSAGGDSDSFTLVYTAKGNALQASGNFFGRILYTVRPIGSSSQDTVYLNAYLESSDDFRVEVSGGAGADMIHLNSTETGSRNSYFTVSFKDNPGDQIKIYQEIDALPSDELFNELNRNLLLFQTEGNTEGMQEVPSWTKIERKRTLLYSSEANEDTFAVAYQLDPKIIDQQKAGKFLGKIKFIVDVNGIFKEFVKEVEVEVKPIFEIEVKLPPEGVSFPNLLPNSPPQIREIEVYVKSNLGRPYMIMQNVVSPLTNQEGGIFAEKYFSIKGELLDGAQGKLAYNDFESVPDGEIPVYFSDKNGSSAHVKVYYRLRPYPEMAPGSYATSIMYSLGEM